MALSFARIDKGNRIWGLFGGARVVTLDVTLASGDYSSGIDLGSNAAKFGARKVISVLGAMFRQAGGTMWRLLPCWDANTGKLRLFKSSAAVTTAFTEVVDADLSGGGDILRVVVLVI